MKARCIMLLVVMGILALGCSSGKSRVPRNAQVIEYYTKAVESNPEYAAGHYYLGVYYEANGDNKLAKREYRAACKLGLESACEQAKKLQSR